MEKIITTYSEAETEALGKALGELLFPGAVILVNGDLGAGKTAFARGVARGLKISAPITSPTFTLLHVYQGKIPFYHFDLYRLDDVEELYEIGMEEYLLGEGVSLFEWAEKFCEIFPLEKLVVTIVATGPTTRLFTFSAQSDSYIKIIGALGR
ncbi:MAG: tRNA (adenosine(37)-N6)-threonylcarbamoyltransferase complex ATPase subunit type 1 TsaE [Firmicutes bacterium]|nr:tRNA (adenosine(37)-N6)-threonylcarbamoyltransferase complex ATPase subunit type 1 TsaE [Bacillota bacterium]